MGHSVEYPQHDRDNYHIFGQGSRVDGLHLFCAFLLVAAYLTCCSQALNYLEIFTAGTPYHLMMQRIYREIMMVGIGAFVFTIFNDTGKSLPFDFEPAFGFADVCCFVMSFSFCIYGMFIMLGSVGQAQNWSVASKISSEELHANVDRIQKNYGLLWRNRYLPFSVTREQVEFRILNAIFSSLYSISTNHASFDFGMFLTMSHEANILSIIDISPFKWCLVLIMAGAVALKLELYHSTCTTLSCYQTEEIWTFTLCGCANAMLAIILFYWGRLSELRLLRISGVQSIDDYPVFLMTEVNTRLALEQMTVTAGSGFVKDAITEIMNEAEESRIARDARESIRRTQMFHRFTTFSKPAAKVSPYGGGGGDAVRAGRSGSLDSYMVSEESLLEGCIAEEEPAVQSQMGRRLSDIATSAADSGGGESDGSGLALAMGSEVGLAGQYVDENESGFTRGQIPSHYLTKEISDISPFVSNSSVCGDHLEIETSPPFPLDGRFGIGEDKLTLPASNKLPPLRVPSDTSSMNRADAASVSTIPQTNSSSNGGAAASAANGVRTSLARHRSRRRSLLQNLKRTVSKSAIGGVSGNSWRQSMEDFFKRRKSNMSAEEQKQSFKSKMKENIQKQICPEVFMFSQPELFYGLITVVITCNSFYIAWWVTNFALIASGLKQPALVMILSLLPALITIPISALAIRSSSILKAITCLKLEIVATVLDNTHSNSSALSVLRVQLVKHLSNAASDPKIGMLKVCRRFAEDPRYLTRLEFEAILVHYKIFYPSKKLDFLFRSIDVNGGNTIDMGEFESFLFPVMTNDDFCKRRQFFDEMNNQMLRSAGQREAAKRIISFLDPLNKTGGINAAAAGRGSVSGQKDKPRVQVLRRLRLSISGVNGGE